MKVKVDTGKNRLYLDLSGKISKTELDKLYTDVRFGVSDLKPGFYVISDLSKCNLAHLSGVSSYKKIMHYLVRSGVGEVVRIVNKKSLLFRQILNLASKTCGYIPIYVHTLQEAEEKLEHPNRRNGLRFRFQKLPPAEYILHSTKNACRIDNISISGCKACTTTQCPSAGEEIHIVIALSTPDASLNEFATKARVIRTEENVFAAEFIDLTVDQRNQLWRGLIQQFEHEL